MSGFSFGTPTTTSGGLFNQNNPVGQSQGAFNFGTSTGTGFNFGSATQPQPQQPTTQTGGFNFSVPTGTTSAAPAPAPAPAFGNLGSFGTNPNFGGFGPPSTATTSTAPSFGGFNLTATPATATSATNFSGFTGTQITTTSIPSFSGFGLPTSTTTPSTTATPAFGGFGLTGTSATPAFGGFSGTTSTSSAAPTFVGLGPPNNVTTTAFTGLPAGATTTAPTTHNTSFGGFGLKATTPGFNFGTSTAPTPITPSLGVPLTAPAASLNFGSSTTNTGTLSTFGAVPSTAGGIFAPKTTTITGLFGATSTSQASALPLTATTAAPAPSLGLGGTDLNATQPKSSEGKQDNIKVKDIIIPGPIAETVENIKNFIKQQKSSSSDIARATIRKLANVSNEIQSFEWSLQEIGNCVEKNYSQIKLLRAETAAAIQSMEMAQRTHETPIGLQFENLAPLKYFQDLVQKYESDMITFRNQIELTEKHMRSLTNPQSFTPEDLKRGLQQIHESFIALAGRLHEIHQKVEAQKEHYLNLRKYYLKDGQNVFAELETDTPDLDVSNISSGPTPFSSLTGAASVSWQNRSNTNRNLAGFGGVNSNANPQLINLTDSTGNGIANKPMFGSSGFGIVSGPMLNLQTPPLGAKRNKQ